MILLGPICAREKFTQSVGLMVEPMCGAHPFYESPKQCSRTTLRVAFLVVCKFSSFLGPHSPLQVNDTIHQGHHITLLSFCFNFSQSIGEKWYPYHILHSTKMVKDNNVNYKTYNVTRIKTSLRFNGDFSNNCPYPPRNICNV